ncbi:CopG family transcriptional regulator [Halolamina salifodinae]|uniref:Putative Zn-ribbon and HTH transcriptional regulator n=1 Tax=Halolamina salifodinae TaxID=1202767 RepID=A0A8T4H225_9EURY|nr:CopG family transcriptional regulator [Halolamina salifodinae]MBP1987874.1 putative Zn-ribbon and HTH transcriptional regulator [Halolamina salifodinae]
MAEEQPQSLPADLEGWLDEQAAESGRDRQEVLVRAVATYRLLSEAEDAADVAPLDQQVGDLADRVEELDADTDDRIEDVRDRIVQVMQVAKAKADANHDHPELAERIDELEAESAEDVESLRRALAHLDRRVESGFDNYEAVLTTLADRADGTDEKLDTLASAVVGLRRRVAELEAADARRDAVEAIQREANSRNVAAADCEGCGKQVQIGLLSAPRCPHCEEPFEGIEPGSWFLGSATLVIGDRPALTGESFEPETAEEVFVDDD